MNCSEIQECDVPEYAPDGEDHAKKTSIGDSAPGHNPSQRDDEACLDVTNHRRAHRAGSDDDEKLRQIDHGCQKSAL